MPWFDYRAKSPEGQTASGSIEARNKDEAIEIISRTGNLPITIEERKKAVSSSVLLQRKGVSKKEVYVFSRQMTNLLKAGVPILRAIEIIRQQSSNTYFSEILEKIYQGIKDGRSFSDCLADYPKVFSTLYVAMVRVGEEGGHLQEILLKISEHQKQQLEITGKVKTALAYPVFMFLTGLATIFFILIFVMPKITKLFSNLGQSLPLPTQILMGISHALRAGWFIVIPLFLLIVFSLIRWTQTSSGRRILDEIILKIPIVGSLILHIELSRFCTTLELLLRSGISLVRAIKIATPTLDNTVIRQDLIKSKDSIEAGETFAHSFEQCRCVPGMMMNLIRVGEESGLLEDTLSDIAENYTQESNEIIKTFTTILEPAMILIVGGLVGLVVIAMLLPIFQMDILAR